MPAIDFPASPTLNDEYSFEGRTWRWNATGWEVKEYPAALLAGTAANPSLYFSGDPNTGLYSPGADQVAISTGGDERLRITSAGLVGIGTSAPGNILSVAGTTHSSVGFSTGTDGATSGGLYNTGTTSKSISISADPANAGANSNIAFLVDASERARIDSSGRLLVGTSSAISTRLAGTTFTAPLQVAGIAFNSNSSLLASYSSSASGNSYLAFARSKSGIVGTNTAVIADDRLGAISFGGYDGADQTEAVRITAEVDGTPGTNDMPGRLVFSVTADGAASPTEALRISNNRAITVSDGGNVVLGTTTGTKIGTATTQKLGFYNATPVVQPAAVANATDAASVITQLNDLLAKLRTLGIIAT